MARRKTKPKDVIIKVESSESSPSYDDSSSVYEMEDEEWTEGSVNTCHECFEDSKVKKRNWQLDAILSIVIGGTTENASKMTLM